MFPKAQANFTLVILIVCRCASVFSSNPDYYIAKQDDEEAYQLFKQINSHGGPDCNIYKDIDDPSYFFGLKDGTPVVHFYRDVPVPASIHDLCSHPPSNDANAGIIYENKYTDYRPLNLCGTHVV